VALGRVLERLPRDGRPSWKEFPSQVEVAETPPWEAKAMARAIDFQKRKADPTYKGAFHEKRRKSSSKGKKRRR
jgi:ATP-dependent RNA helicase RhlE